MNDPARLAQPAPGVRELEAVLAVVAIVIVGPLAIAGAAVFATLTQSWRRSWLAALALPSTATALFLWPFARRHVVGAAEAIRAAHAHGDPGRVALAVWPHLWPVWLCAPTL